MTCWTAVWVNASWQKYFGIEPVLFQCSFKSSLILEFYCAVFILFALLSMKLSYNIAYFSFKQKTYYSNQIDLPKYKLLVSGLLLWPIQNQNTQQVVFYDFSFILLFCLLLHYALKQLWSFAYLSDEIMNSRNRGRTSRSHFSSNIIFI